MYALFDSRRARVAAQKLPEALPRQRPSRLSQRDRRVRRSPSTSAADRRDTRQRLPRALPTGTMRSLPPLPRTRTTRHWIDGAERQRTSSETRQPLA